MTIDEFREAWYDGSPTMQLRTSGSTGLPKVITVEKSRMLASAEATCRFFGLKGGDTALLCLPLDYIAGKMMAVRSIYAGLKLECVAPSGHPLAECEADSYDFVAMVPMQVYNTLTVPAEREKLMRIKHLIIGGGAIDKELQGRLSDFPNAIWSTYGMTETLSHIALRKINGVDASHWYTPLPGVNIAVTDDGRLVIDAPHVCTDTLITNDIAEVDTDANRFRILGRADNVICSGGLKIRIEEVEDMLRGHIPCGFMITGAKDEKFGEVPVMLYDDRESAAADSQPLQTDKDAAPPGIIDKTQLCGICRSVLPKHFCPKAYIKVPQLPFTPTGKPARARARTLAELALASNRNTLS